jgi:Domain of unknown function (DUF19)
MPYSQVLHARFTAILLAKAKCRKNDKQTNTEWKKKWQSNFVFGYTAWFGQFRGCESKLFAVTNPCIRQLHFVSHGTSQSKTIYGIGNCVLKGIKSFMSKTEFNQFTQFYRTVWLMHHTIR